MEVMYKAINGLILGFAALFSPTQSVVMCALAFIAIDFVIYGIVIGIVCFGMLFRANPETMTAVDIPSLVFAEHILKA